METLYIPLSQVQVGDIIEGNGDIEVTAVLGIRDDMIMNDGSPALRFEGRIVSGYGRSKKVHAWTDSAASMRLVRRGARPS